MRVARRGSVDFSAIFFVKAIQFNPDGWTDRLFKDLAIKENLKRQVPDIIRLPRFFTVVTSFLTCKKFSQEDISMLTL